MNETITDDKITNITDNKTCKYQNLSFSSKELISAQQNKKEKLVNIINNGLISLRSCINRKEISENKNPGKTIQQC